MGASLKKLLIRNKKFYNGVVDNNDDADAYRDMVVYVDHALQTTQKSYMEKLKLLFRYINFSPFLQELPQMQRKSPNQVGP